MLPVGSTWQPVQRRGRAPATLRVPDDGQCSRLALHASFSCPREPQARTKIVCSAGQFYRPLFSLWEQKLRPLAHGMRGWHRPSFSSGRLWHRQAGRQAGASLSVTRTRRLTSFFHDRIDHSLSRHGHGTRLAFPSGQVFYSWHTANCPGNGGLRLHRRARRCPRYGKASVVLALGSERVLACAFPSINQSGVPTTLCAKKEVASPPCFSEV